MALAVPATTFFQQHQFARPTLQVTTRDYHHHRATRITRAGMNNGMTSMMPLITRDIQNVFQHAISGSEKFIAFLTKKPMGVLVQAIANALFEFTDEVNVYYHGNFAPVDEIGSRVLVKIVEGAIPHDFPPGVYIRNGPNPQFGANPRFSSLVGTLNLHWFQGDGMLHATYFGQNGQVSYKNKFVETDGYKEEKKQGKRLWFDALEGDSRAIILGYVFNQMQFGTVNKVTCNTSAFTHAGRLFVNAEAGNPYEIDPSTLSTIGEWDIIQQWNRPFTSHPKVVQETNELAIFGFAPFKPYYMTALVSADGQRITNKCDVGLDFPSFSHEMGVTKNYDLILDLQFSIDPQRLFGGGKLTNYDANGQSRMGIKPRLGNASSIQWFPIESNFTFHVVNAYEDGDEVVVYGCRAKRPFLMAKEGMDRLEWFSRGIRKCSTNNKIDFDIDGALFTSIHEWRFNLQTGVVNERDLTNHTSSMDMPKMNEKYVGSKNSFAYASAIHTQASEKVGMPKYGQLVKIHFSNTKDGECNLELYECGHGIYFSEPLFVPRPSCSCEDDGWIVTYVHDENNNTSEVHIIDAQKFSSPPVARIQLPQRVPYGFHSIYLQGLF